MLNNNNCVFDKQYYHQLEGTGMGNDLAAPYACLAIGYQEEEILFPIELPRFFDSTDCISIQTAYDRYMDDGFLIWPCHLDINIFINILNDLHPNIKYTIEAGQNSGNQQSLNMLDITVILHDNRTIETEIYYKETNTHSYLDYNSHHPDHIKKNLPFNLAKRVMIFTSNAEKEEAHLNHLYDCFLKCGYPNQVLDKAFHDAKLQGPAPNPANKKKIVPLITTYNSNYSSANIVQQGNFMLNSSSSTHIQETFKNCQVILSLRQAPSLLRQLSRSEFTSEKPDYPENGLVVCQDKRCKLCKLYIQPCKSFTTSNGFEWVIRRHITCHSLNVLYYLKCLACDGSTTYTGKTNNLRFRMNGHISGCRLGNTTDIFDNHVFKCMKDHNYHDEPFFHIYTFMSIKHEYQLTTYENYLHKRGFDTMNAPK